MGQFSGKVAVITAGTSGMALATAKLLEGQLAKTFVHLCLLARREIA